MHQALKKGLKGEVKVLRFILSEIKYEEIDKQKELNNEETVDLLRKELKKRKEAIVLFKKGQRNDLVEDEERQLKIIERYLPQELSENELLKIINDVIKDAGDTSNPGRIIGMVIAKVKGQADGSTVAKLVKDKLQKQTAS